MIFFRCKFFSIYGHKNLGWIRMGIQPKMLDPDPDSMIPDSSDETEKNPE